MAPKESSCNTSIPIKPNTCQNYFYSSTASFIREYKSNGFTILQLNTAGINSIKKFDKIKILLTRLKCNFDIILLGETKLKMNFPINLYHLNGYSALSCCRDSKNSGGGLLLFIRKGIVIYEVEKFSSSFEMICFKTKIDKKEIKFMTFYRQPIHSSYTPFLELLENKLRMEPHETIILGDINLDANMDNSDSKNFVRLLNSYDFSIMNTFKTRNASGRVIDHVISNFHNEYSMINSTVTNSISDHNLIVTQILNLATIRKKRKIQINKTDYKKLRQNFISLCNNTCLINEADPNLLAKNLVDITNKSISKSTYSKIITLKDLPLCAWYNNRIVEAIHEKDKISKKYRSKRCNINYKLKLHVASKKLDELIQIEKYKYINRSLDTKNSKLVWQNINNLLGRNNKDYECVLLNDQNELITNENEIAQMFNKFFINSVTSLKETCNNNFDGNLDTHMKSQKVSSTIMLEDTDDQEVLNAISELKNSSPGIDNIFSKTVKELSQEICPLMVQLINCIFNTGVYPECFKSGLTIPINKSGDKTNVADYRPVTMLSAYNKIVEKIILKRLQSFTLNHEKIIYSHQFGFRPKCNTEIAAVELIQYIQKSIDDRQKVSMISMDLKKAFDIVDLENLLSCLYDYGIRGRAHDLIKSYLVDRSQRVRIGNSLSDAISFSQGVVQGSIIGPWLFTLFINNISRLKVNGKILLYADDCVLINVHKLHEQVEPKICEDMKIIMKFLNKQKLILNESKTNVMIFHSTQARIQKPDNITIQLENDNDEHSKSITINRMMKTKYLGLIIDENLKWDEHVKHLENKLACTAGVLWKLKNRLSITLKKRIYAALFESHLNYMIPIWGSANENIINSLQVLQNRALRNLYNLDRHTNRVLMYTHMVGSFLPIRGIFFLNTTALMYKCIHSSIHTNISFELVDNAVLRSDPYWRPTTSKASFGARCITAVGPRMYNELVPGIQNSPHIHSFKWNVRVWLKNEARMELCLSSNFLKKYIKGST